ncbi:MAG: GreA/GreB family elongation factor [Alphaproteobacteria bacterium]
MQSRKISIQSPLGKALIGREVGDSVEVTTPNGVRYFEVVAVRFK